MTIKRGEVYLAALDPTVGGEIAKTRPVVIVSGDYGNKFAATVTVLPITSADPERIYPFEVRLPQGSANLPKVSRVKASHIRSIDKSRLIKRFGMLDEEHIAKIEKAIKVHLDLP
jgi:mRNA interferase MazF